MQQGKKSPSDRRPVRTNDEEDKEAKPYGTSPKKPVKTFVVHCSMCFRGFHCPETQDGDSFMEDMNRFCASSTDAICALAVSSKSNKAYVSMLAKH